MVFNNDNNEGSRVRAISFVLEIVIPVIALLMILYHLLATQYLFLAYDLHKNLHLSFGLILVYLSFIKKDSGSRHLIQVMIWVLISLAATIYVFIFYNDLVMRIGIPTIPDIVLALTLIVVTMEATRRSFGIMLPVFSLFFLAYTFLGHYIPGGLHLPYFSTEHILSKIALDFRGIYGFILGISANYIFLFVIFGSLMKSTGTVRFFEQIGRLVGKKFRGGPALSAVTTSVPAGARRGHLSSEPATGPNCAWRALARSRKPPR